MRIRVPSPFYLFYRRVVAYVCLGKVLSYPTWLGRVVSGVFASLVWMKQQTRNRKPSHVSATVVSVGNIVVGGAGKTPTVLWLAQQLRDRGYSCAVLTRGYMGECSKKRHYTIVDPNRHLAKEVGDEPLLMAKKLPPGSVWVHKERKRTAQAASKEFDILLLDDGLQYTQLHRDVEVVLVNGQDPLGGGHFFPRGRLRDFPERLHSADFILVNGSCSEENRMRLRMWSQAPQIQVIPRLEKVFWSGKGEAASIRDMAVGVFCGLGFPQGFVHMLKQAGAKIIGTYFLPDHAGITKEELEYFSHKVAMRRGVGILCTEKDYVKLGDWAKDLTTLPIGVVQMAFDFIDQEGEALIQHICHVHETRIGKTA